MIKRMAISGVLIGLLVASLLYCISPGEVEVVWSAARHRMSNQVDLILSETSNRGTKAIEQVQKAPVASSTTTGVVRKITPDPFRPFGPNRPSAANGFLVWLRGPEAVAVWLSMVALALAGKYALRRRFRFEAQQRMALTLSKAVREM